MVLRAAPRSRRDQSDWWEAANGGTVCSAMPVTPAACAAAAAPSVVVEMNVQTGLEVCEWQTSSAVDRVSASPPWSGVADDHFAEAGL